METTYDYAINIGEEELLYTSENEAINEKSRIPTFYVFTFF